MGARFMKQQYFFHHFYIGLEALHQQWNDPDLMSIPIWAELAQTNKLSDTKKTHILRANKLEQLIDHL